MVLQKTISRFKKADGLVVGSQLCEKITQSLSNRQNIVTNLNKNGIQFEKENLLNWITKFIKPKIESSFREKTSKTKETLGLHVVVKFNL